MADQDSVDIHPSDAINVIDSTLKHDQTVKSNQAYDERESAKTTSIDTLVFKNVSPEVVKGTGSKNTACKLHISVHTIPPVQILSEVCFLK